MAKYILFLHLFFNNTVYSQYIKAGNEFGFGILINNLIVSSPQTFNFKCKFISSDSSLYSFKIDSLAVKYPKEYEEITMFFNDMIEYGYYKLSDEEKSKFIETLNNGILTFNIYSHSIPIILKEDETYNIFGEVNMGWPSSFGLFITKGKEFIFYGVSDYELNRTIDLPNNIPIQVSFEKILYENEQITEYYTYYNVLYKYGYKNQNIILNQNEIVNVDNYTIYQGLSRKQILNEGKQISDGGVNGISFIIIKR